MSHSEILPPSSDEIRQYAEQAGYFQLLGLKVDEAQAGNGSVSLLVDTHLLHPQQIVHGGVIFTLADTAMAMALMSVLPPATPVSTIEAKINYLHAVRTGKLRAEAAIIHQGRSTAVLEATVYVIDGAEQQAIARMLGTFHIARRQAT